MRLSLGILLVCVAVVGVAGYAVGAGSNSSDVTLCAAKSDGSLTLGAKGKCGKGDKKVTIAEEGPRGPAGAKGDPGATGSPGAQGVPGNPGSAANVVSESVRLVTGPPTPTCPANPGTFCKFSMIEGGWRNFGGGLQSAGFYKDPSGIVHLSGVVTYESNGGAFGGFEPVGPFYLPAGFRPSATEDFEAAAGSGLTSSQTVEVRADGTVATAQGPVSLSGITFRAG